MIFQKSYKYNVDVYPLHTDYKQGYNNINRDQFTEIMKQFGILSKLHRLVQNDNGKD